MGTMDCLCIALGAWAFGIFSAFFAYGWLEGQSDQYANIPWRKSLDTCINWDLAKWRAKRVQEQQ